MKQIAVLAVLALAVAARGQHTLDSSALHPITTPPRDAGVYNLARGRWMAPQREAQLRANSLAVYANTCTWTGGAFYTGTGSCEDYFDEGRIPGGVGGNNPPGSSTDNAINFFQLGYCTSEATGTLDVKVGFFHNLGGTCVGGVPPTPPPLTANPNLAAYFDFGAAAGYPLPGNASPPAGVTCWLVGINPGNAGFCLQSDGDGVFNNVAALDQFTWSWQMENVAAPGTAVSGLIIAGDPATGQPGGCTYNIPCGTNFFSSAPCGTGLDTSDSFWTNVDAWPVGGGCSSSPAAGSNCYWFGGYPANPYASFWMVLGSAGSCAGCTGNPTSYCTSGTSSNGCLPTLSLAGVPSPRNLAPCTLTASGVEGQRAGILFYGLQSQSLPIGNGFLCVKTPVQRMGPLQSGGAAGQCNGTLMRDINAFWGANPSALGQPLFAGETFFVQGWYRDPGVSTKTSLTNALSLSLCP